MNSTHQVGGRTSLAIEALSSLELLVPAKYVKFAEAAKAGTAAKESGVHVVALEQVAKGLVPVEAHSRDVEETGCKLDRGQNEQGTQCAGSKVDRVQEEPCRLKPIYRVGTLKPKSHFCAVPNAIFQGKSAFEDPCDFMVYLFLFSLSFGFGKNTCSVGQHRLSAFTGASRNRIRRSLERLVTQDWIKEVGGFEPGQVARTWQIFSPDEKGITDQPTYFQHANGCDAGVPATGVKMDGVKIEPGPICTQRGSSANPETGSKMEHIINSTTNNSKNTLSRISNVPSIEQYFENLKPKRKLKSERVAFGDLKADYDEQSIADCLEYLQTNGLPGGEPCHSPMAFLSRAMAGVLEKVRAARAKCAEKQKREQALASAEHSKREAEAREKAEWAMRERAFKKAFPGEDRQREVLHESCRGTPFRATSEAGWAYAVGKWWESLSNYERIEAVQ